jgi:hypothetical protein
MLSAYIYRCAHSTQCTTVHGVPSGLRGCLHNTQVCVSRTVSFSEQEPQVCRRCLSWQLTSQQEPQICTHAWARQHLNILSTAWLAKDTCVLYSSMLPQICRQLSQQEAPRILQAAQPARSTTDPAGSSASKKHHGSCRQAALGCLRQALLHTTCTPHTHVPMKPTTQKNQMHQPAQGGRCSRNKELNWVVHRRRAAQHAGLVSEHCAVMNGPPCVGKQGGGKVLPQHPEYCSRMPVVGCLIRLGWAQPDTHTSG